MWTPAQLLCALLLPVGLGLLLTAMTRDLRATATSMVQRGLGGLLLTVTAAVAYVATASATDAQLILPRFGFHWLAWTTVALIPALAVATPPGWWRWVVQGLVAVGGGALLLQPVCHSHQDLLVSGAWIIVAVGSVLLTGWATSSQQTPPLVEQAAAAIAAGCVAAGSVLSGSTDLPLLVMIIPAAIVGQAVARQPQPWLGGSLATAQLLAWHLLANGGYSELTWFGALPLALALPAGALAARLGRTPRASAAWRISATIAVGVLGVVVILLFGQPAETAGDGSAYGY